MCVNIEKIEIVVSDSKNPEKIARAIHSELCSLSKPSKYVIKEKRPGGERRYLNIINANIKWMVSLSDASKMSKFQAESVLEVFCLREVGKIVKLVPKKKANK